MIIRKKQIITIVLSLALVLTFIPLMPGQQAHAMEMLHPEMTLNTYGLDDNSTYVVDNSEELAYANSSNESIATVGVEGYRLDIFPKKPGTVNVTVTSVAHNTDTVKVTITRNYFKGWLDEETEMARTWYGTTRIKVFSLPGAYGKLKVGKKTYTVKKLGKTGSRIIKLKSPSKLKLLTPVVLTMKINGASKTVKTKLYSETDFYEVTGAKKTIKVRTFNVHKGDLVKVKFKGKTYTKKIKKSFDDKSKTITFKVKKKVAKNASMTITILNKNKKKLRQRKIKLINGIYPEPYEDDEGEDDESLEE